MLTTKEVEVRLNGNNVNYYKQLGYDIPMRKASESMKYQGFDYVTDFTKSIIVKIEDLPLHSSVLVDSTCDYCGQAKQPIKYADYNRQTKNGTLKCCCEKCASFKRKEVIFERYGYESPMQVPEFREKVWQTNHIRYGHKAPAQSLEVREKMVQTFYANSSQKASKQQRYICNLYQGCLNFPVKYYCADICLPNDNLVIEYDGSGHNLSVMYGVETEKECRQKEIVRYNVIKKEGYKQMRIISESNKLPSDSTLLQMLSEAKQYFSETNHSWCSYDIDKSLLFNAEHKDGISYNFGKLRTIKDSDLITEETNAVQSA